MNALQTTKINTIGRFKLQRILGKGAQGKVYLAEDPHLQRQVAIKTLLLADSPDKEKQILTLLGEARIVGKLKHPNIVALYDAGEMHGTPYLVFEYVEGTNLASLIKEQEKLPVVQAVETAIQILDGIGYAHQQQIVHRDLKPSNILIDREGTARVMDFGIARRIDTEKGGETALFGTPIYMAPEYITGKTYSPRSDIFSVGMMLFEMLTGTPAVKSGNVYETLHAIVNTPFRPPSQKNSGIDERLDDIVLKALAKDPDNRYQTAQEMLDALDAYLNPAAESGDSSAHSKSTLDFLLRRMRHKSDFPALSHTMSTINKIVSADNKGVASLSNVILKDFSLTNNLLKLVNTAFYGQFGGTISTISRAVVILGFDTIRNVAITLVLFEHLQNKGHAAQLKDDIVASLFSGILAREMVSKTGIRDAEEGFICSMFHSLGRLLVTFYFPEEMAEINKVMEAGNTETFASTKVLGVSFEDLAIGVARSWHFPDKIVFSMRKITDDKVKKPYSEEEKLRMLSGLSNELCAIVRSTDPAKKGEQLKALVQRYGQAVSVSEKQLSMVVEGSISELLKESGVLNFDPQQSSFFAKVTNWNKPGGTGAKALADGDPALTLNADSTLKMDTPQPAPEVVLSAGIQDITNTLVSEYKLNEILTIILETMYRGIGFTRVLLCVKDVRANTMSARYGLGKDIDKILKTFNFSLNYTPDVFHAAISQGVDIFIEDIDAGNIKDRIPGWYRQLVPAQSFILFPVVIDKKAVGMFYGDKDALSDLSIQPKELSLLKTLRNQAVLAIRQKH
ncbi:MAG: protein kinase domain-containing protein [Burkholderiales bacterium]